MDLISMCVYLIIGLLGVAYPILFQVVAGLDQKYNSILVLALFKQEPETKWYVWFLKASLISIALWGANWPAPSWLDCWMVSHSAKALVYLSTAGLVIFFFLFVQKILKYYSTIEFLEYLMAKDKEVNQSGNLQYFNIIADLLYFSVTKENVAVSRTISEYLYGKFKDKRLASKDVPVVYPEDYYTLTYRTIEPLSKVQNTEFAFLGYRAAGAIWLLGEFDDAKISSATFNRLWRNLRLCLNYRRVDFILFYWQTACQYFSLQLDRVLPDYSAGMEVLNYKQVEDRNKEREQFLEFNFALGGLLLYRKEFNGVKRIFAYSSSNPPDYVLLPIMMDDVFHWFFRFIDTFSEDMFNLSSKYPFPDLEGASADDSILASMRDYIALLFLRQYELQQYDYRIDPIAPPNIPKKHFLKVRWLENMDLFQDHVTAMMKDNEMLDTLGMSITDKDRIRNRRVKAPLDFISDLKDQLKASIHQNLQTQGISPTKYQTFQDTSREILRGTFFKYKKIENVNGLGAETVDTIIAGNSYLSEKSAFADDQEATHVNFDSFLAKAVSEQFNGGVLHAFDRISSTRYFLEQKDVMGALKKLMINSEHIIISFGIDLDIIKYTTESGGDLPCEVVLFPSGNNVYTKEAFFVVKRSFLPKFTFSSPAEDIIKTYELQKLDETYGLYASVIDLNRNVDIRKTQKALREDDLLTKVLVFIYLRCAVSFDKAVQCVRIEVASPYGQQGIPSKLTDVKKF